MKVLLMVMVTSIVALQVKIQNLIPLQAEEHPVSASNEENGNASTTQILLQETAQKLQGVIKLGLPKQHGSTNCYMSNGYYTAKSNGACFLANTDGSKVIIDFTAKTYTQYKFTTKMTESNAHNNNITPHGGFKPCNKDSTGNTRGSSPEFWFIDRNGDWGYGTYNGGFGHTAHYKNKAYYGKADPHGGGDHVWTITMKWTGAQYVIQDWDVDGVNFGKYKGKNSGCSKTQNLVTTPKVWAYPGSTVGIKDFEFSQANSIDELGVAAATTQAATTAAPIETGTRSSHAINLDFSKLVHEKFSQEAAHGTWQLQLNLNTDPCSLVKCKADSQCHAVGKCTKASGVCTKPFLAKNTACDDGAEKTINDVCDGKGLCAGVNIGLGCLEMRFDASKFAEGYKVQKWTDLAKKGHDATAYSTVPAVKMDQTDKKRPYVPVYNGKWWNVAGNTFVKTIVSVFRRGDGATTWNNHGATLARKSGRSSNWLFENGRQRLHSNQLPDRAWKNGKELTKGNHFDMAPINKFFVLVIEVNDRNKGAAAYYLGRSDHSVTRIDLQEVLAYDRKLTDVERKQVEAYLAKKWNIDGN